MALDCAVYSRGWTKNQSDARMTPALANGEHAAPVLDEDATDDPEVDER